MGKPHIRLRTTADAEVMPRAALSLYGNDAYHGASFTMRDVAGWNASPGSADNDLLPNLPELQYRSRDIHRNNGLAHSIVQTSVDNIVGTGLRLCLQPDYLRLSAVLGPEYDKDWADEFAAIYESLFHEWWWSTACHAGDTKTGDMLSEEFQHAKFNNGGVLILPLWLPKRRDGFATKLQTVEVDRLSNPKLAQDTPLLRGGIEFNADETGEPIACHIRKGHPGDSYLWAIYKAQEWVRIPRRTPFGRLRWIHDFDSFRADQTRGAPLLAAVLAQFKNIDRYVAAEIQAALMNACIFASMTTPLSGEDIAAMYAEDPKLWLEARDKRVAKMSSGSMIALNPGDKLEPFMPQRPAPQFGQFHKNVARIIAVGADMPYEVAMKDYSDSNYSNTRAAMVEFWRSVTRKRDRLGAGTMDPINGLFMEEMVHAGRITAPRFYEFRRAYQRCTWLGPGRGYVDKVKEATGDAIMLDKDMTTVQRIAAEQGMHWRELYDQRATERAYARKLGLPENVVSKISASPGDEPLPDEDEQVPARPKSPPSPQSAGAHA